MRLRLVALIVLLCLVNRKLLSSGMRDPVRSFHGLLPHPDLHPIWTDRHHLVGQFLAEPERDTRQGSSGSHHSAHDDNPHVIHQRCSAQDLLCEIHRRLPGDMLRYGLCIAARQVLRTT